jgi:hypothetical protein
MKLAEIKRIVALLVTFGTQAAAGQIANGDFSSGLNSFSSSYAYVPANGGVFTQPGEFGLTTNPSTGFTNPYTSYTEHTGDSAGLMLIADGYNPGVNVWSESVTVSPSTAYVFTAWVASAYFANPASLGLFSNDQQIGTSFSAPSTAGLWTEWTALLTTGPADSQISLSIQDLNLNVFGAGNDFTLDDLALNRAATAPEPASWPLVGSVLLGFVVSACLRRRRGHPQIVTNRQSPNDLPAERAQGILRSSALVLTAMLAPTAAWASATLGVISYNTLIPGAPGSPGVNDFEIDNFTGSFALPPDFAVNTSLTFQNSSLTLTFQDRTQQTILLGDLTPGVYTPATVQFSSTIGIQSAVFTATLDETNFLLAGDPVQALSQQTITELDEALNTGLSPDSDFAVISVATTSSLAPEPSFTLLDLVAFGAIAYLTNLFRRSE